MSSISDDLREAITEVGGEELKAALPPEEETSGSSVEPSSLAAAAPPAGAVGSAPDAGQQPAEPSTDQGGWTQDKAPQSWTPAAREKWNAIPEDIRKEIVRREEAAVNGVRQLQEKYAPHEHFTNALAPLIQEAIQHNVAPEAYINQVMSAERVLRTADVPGKFQALLGIADQYGIPLREIINESVGQKVLGAPQQAQAPAVHPAVAAQLQEMNRWRAQQESQAVSQTVEQFSQGKEFFSDVRVMMADLIDSGAARTLDEAYDRACWAIPEVRTVMLQRQQSGAAVTQRQQRAAGISPPTGGKVVVDEDFGNEDDVSDTIRKAFAQASGRV